MNGGLAASRCGCGTAHVPPRARCPVCGERPDPDRVGGRGRLRSWTVVRSPPAGVEGPVTVGLVELEAGARLMARWGGSGAAEEGDLELEVEVEVVEDGDGGYRFRLA